MESTTKAQTSFNKDHPFPAQLSENRLLNREGSAKETRHFVVDIKGSGLTYSCGDSLGVFPTNDSGEVDNLLQVSGLSGEEPVCLPKTEGTVSLREALTRNLSLASPTKKTLQTFLELSSDNGEKSRLEHLLDRDNLDEMKLYLEHRQFFDLMEEFPSVRFTAQGLVDQLKRLVPRLYSIASSPTLFPEEVHLTVAVVRYETNGRPRKGVASTYLADRCPLNKPEVPVFVAASHFAPPEDPAVDMIMVGPGTGVAPFRSFVQEQKARGGKGRTWLFFGDQHRATDFLYEEEFLQALDEGSLSRLDLAFSRDQEHKIYVQDRLRENASEIWNWLSGGAHFYVCGDAKRMAVDVEKALLEILQTEGGMNEEEATHFLKQLRKERRYQKDVY